MSFEGGVDLELNRFYHDSFLNLEIKAIEYIVSFSRTYGTYQDYL